MDNVNIVQVKQRAKQGITRPFYCQADNGKWYWVKGQDAGKSGLCYEWIAGRMAQDFGLPIPCFIQATVPEDLIKYSARDDISELGSGTVFASEHVFGSQEYAVSNIRDTPPEIQVKLLMFDWWIQNNDRMLDEEGGNVNLLWLPGSKEVKIIDHNIAFDSSFSNDKLVNRHVFRHAMSQIAGNSGTETGTVMLDIASRLSTYFSELPEEWTETAGSLPDFSFGRMKAILNRFQNDSDLFGDISL